MIAAGPSFELRQTRDFTASEQRDLLDLWRKLQWPDGTGRWYAVASYAYYAFAGFLAFSIAQAVYELFPFAANLAVQLAVAGAGFTVGFFLVQWITTRMWLKTYWEAASAHNRFVIEADGLRSIGADGEALFRWHGIAQPVHSDRFIAVGGKGRWLLLAKAAFADQDIEGFCAELQRRWNAAREQTA